MTIQRIDPQQLTQSKKRVITILRRKGPQTKTLLCKLGDIGWATVVKVVTQLGEDGIVEQKGITIDKPGDLRSSSELYGLRSDYPLTIGIDVEYNTTRLVLTNLAGDIIGSIDQHDTPHGATFPEVVEFLSRVIEKFIRQHSIRYDYLVGVGIGIPGIGFPVQSRRENQLVAQKLENELQERFGVNVRVGTNTHAYTVFEKWTNETFASDDFIFVSIRTGVGTGIFEGGTLYTGMTGLSGEIGHMKLIPGGAPCRCGGTGCVETIVNEHHLVHEYRMHVLKDPNWCLDSIDQRCRFEGLADLFSRAKAGDPAATRIVEGAARYLGKAIANCIAVLDITNIILSGHFGPDGDIWIPVLRDIVRSEVLPGVDIDIRYIPFDANGHTLGAALLVLNQFFLDVPALHA